MTTRLIRTLLLAGAACTLASCVGGSKPADELYVLDAKAPDSDGRPMAISLRIDRPAAAPGLDNQHIAVSDAPHHLTYYTGASWAASLPETLEVFLADSLQQSHRFKSVSGESDGVLTTVSLSTDIADYEVENAEGTPSVHIRLVCQLVNERTHTAIKSFTVEKTKEAKMRKMQSIVAAFNDASSEAAADILDEIASTCSAKKDACLH